jgi:hypothetical protein
MFALDTGNSTVGLVWVSPQAYDGEESEEEAKNKKA